MLEVTGNLLVGSVDIHCWGLIILAKMWLERVSNVSICSSLFWGVPWVLVDLMFFLVCSMWTFAVAMEGGNCFMSSTVRLVQVVKCPLSMAWSKVLFTWLKRDAWYNLASSGLLLAARALSDTDCLWVGGLVGLMVRLTFHMPDVDNMLPSSTVSPYLTTLR